ncbi:MAG: beta-ketoacyl-[acyl-carrier-protein] synthase family protein [Chloroflexota bacterium]
MRRVMVTGVGALTPLGNTFSDSWLAIREGLSGVLKITGVATADIPWKIAGALRNFSPGAFLTPKEQMRFDPVVHYAVAASAMALADAGLSALSLSGSSRDKESEQAAVPDDVGRRDHCGVVIGSSRGAIRSLEAALSAGRSTRLSPYFMPSTTIGMVASSVAQKFRFRGPCLGMSSACASGSMAIGEAFRLIRHGYAVSALAGGSEAPICKLCIEGYGRTGALSRAAVPSASRPFDVSRDGFVLAEGACIIVLEELESALRRNCRIYGEVVGYYTGTDAFHITKPDSDGEAQAMNAALADANLTRDQVDYVSAHATSTIVGDHAEAMAIKDVFAERPVPVSAIKSMTGHMLAASGPFEIACALMSITEGLIPGTINLDKKDPACDVSVTSWNRETEVETALCNSFGFGGINAVVILRKYES